MSSQQARTYEAVDALFAALIGLGVGHVVISPGSRSTPLAVVAALKIEIETHVVLDERSAGFVALGMAKATERPVAMVCTSGSAAANYLPAVVEANRGRVPMIVLTADRPRGFLERDAAQAIDQINLYGNQVRAFVGLGVAHECEAEDVVRRVSLAADALGPNAGPVHINCPFDKPLEPPPGWRPGRVEPEYRAPASVEPKGTEDLSAFVADHQRGVIVAGPRRATTPELDAVERVAAAAGWPILADPLSGFRRGDRHSVLTTGELVLRSPAFVESHLPDAVLRIGGIPTGRATQAWVESLDVPVLIVDPDYRWTAGGPEQVLRDGPASLFGGISVDRPNVAWIEAWRSADMAASVRRRAEVAIHDETELAGTAAVLAAGSDLLWVASSMPVRDLDVMMGPGSTTRVFANRGANGIDGTIASATGLALASSERVTVLIGDLAFLHDVGSLTTATELGVELTIVVIDNGGGAIFGMLPIAGTDDVDFARLFTTPHSRDLVSIASGFGAESRNVQARDLVTALEKAPKQASVRVLVVQTDRAGPFAAYERMVDDHVGRG